MDPDKSKYSTLISQIGKLLQKGRENVARYVNTILVQTYWLIGKRIVEFEQEGKEKAEYGSQLLDQLSNDLSERFGKGFSRSNVFQIRQFYLRFSKIQTLSGQFENGDVPANNLSWSHYIEIMKADSDLEIGFYLKQAEKENWSVRELKRQIKSMLYHRLALSKDKKGVLKLSEQGLDIQNSTDILKDPYVLEFLDIPENNQYLEGELEEKLIYNLQHFY